MVRAYSRHDRRDAKRRGTAYVLVLSITLLLVTIGIAATKLSRNNLKRLTLEEDQANARLYALSALDHTHLLLDGDASWRSTVPDDTWITASAYSPKDYTSDTTIEVKFVDEFDGNIDNDSTQPFRVYARATHSDAVRVYSVELAPDASNNLTRVAHSMRQETND